MNECFDYDDDIADSSMIIFQMKMTRNQSKGMNQ